MQFNTYSDVETWLENRPQFRTDGARATDFRPAKIVDFCEQLNHPERSFRSVHIAGTNGKGTTCSMIASVYQEAGYTVGLYTSPHIEHWRERIKINGVPVGGESVLKAFQQMESITGFETLTYFELSTIAAWVIFDDIGIDIAIVETGMGGRLDATNTIVPKVSVITSIGLDHTEYLGDTLEAIAFEKAGIIKPGVPVVVGDVPAQALQVIRETAESLNSRLYDTTELIPHFEPNSNCINIRHKSGTLRINSDIKSVTSAANVAMAIKVVDLLQPDFVVNNSDLVSGLEHAARNTGLRARMEQLMDDRNWYYDGAHNTEALNVLRTNLERLAPMSSWTVIFTMMGDKVDPIALENIADAGRCIFWKGDNKRTATPEQIKKHILSVYCSEDAEIVDILSALTAEFVIFTGSFYFYNEVRRWIRSTTA